ncbi:recombinase family protein [Ktedonospora formicarum]|uniref:Resolvase n=1 Tax=Ktedonospora formicarum TaxID=2778364 RepID=A0A8J3MWB6_9CHLR|nr:recombinase family protein [Ktedonospora formicarum]GHO48493.1 resolvase [Ktedonospora formicarum]
MSQTIAYLRTSTDKQDLNNQKLEILEWARKKEVKIDEFVEITMSSRKTKKQRRIEEVLEMLADSDMLIVTELSRLGRSTAEVIALVNELVARNIRVIILKQNLDISQHDMHSKIIITLFSLFAELERDMISLRTKEALAAKKKQGITLGKPRGTLQKSKFDADLTRIQELLKLGLSVRKIATFLGYTNHHALNTYITKRQLREQSS